MVPRWPLLLGLLNKLIILDKLAILGVLDLLEGLVVRELDPLEVQREQETDDRETGAGDREHALSTRGARGECLVSIVGRETCYRAGLTWVSP